MVHERIVLAYSGGLDTTIAIPWLAERYHAEIIAVTLDLGQGTDLAGVRERALAVGAVRAHVLDVREEFAHEFILPALQAGAIDEQRRPLATALGRPLIARHLVRIAEMEDATAIARGGTGQRDDQVRLDVSVRALNRTIPVIAPARVWGLTRPQAIDYARQRNISVPAIIDSPYSTDANMWGRSIQCGVLEDPWREPPDDIYTLTRSAARAPDTPAYVEIAFDRGVPISINGVTMGFTELISSLETIAGAHGVGRIDRVESRLTGVKSREIHEAPAALTLHLAHRELETMVIPRDLERLTHQLGQSYADLVYNGHWFTPMREAIDAVVAYVQPRVTGVVRLKFFKGSCAVVGRTSPFAFSDHHLATDDAGETFDHGAAEGLIRIRSLPVETAARRSRATDQAAGVAG